MSKVMNAYGTDEIVRKKTAKKIIEALYGKTNLNKMYSILNKEDSIFFANDLFNEMFFMKKGNKESTFEKRLYKFIPEDFTKNNKAKIKAVFEIIKSDAVMRLYNYGKNPKNLKGKLYKAVKSLFKTRDSQKEILKLLDDENVSVAELSERIYSLLRKEGLSVNEISMKIKDVNQVLRIKRIREVISGKKDQRIKVSKPRELLTKVALEMLEDAGIDVNSKNMRKLKNIIKSYSTYSLNMPLTRKLRKEFPSLSYEKIKRIANGIKELTERFNLEDALLAEKMKRMFDKEIVRELQGKNKNNIDFTSKFNEIIDNYFKGARPEDFLLDSEHKTIVKTVDFYKKNFIIGKTKSKYIRRFFSEDNLNGRPADVLMKNIPVFKDPSILFIAHLDNNYEKNIQKINRYFSKLKNILSKAANTDYKTYSSPDEKWVYDFAKKNLERFKTEFNDFEELEEFFLKLITEDMGTKDILALPVFYEIFKEISNELKIKELQFNNNYEYVFEFVQKMIRKSMLMGSLDGKEDALGKKIISVLYNYYYGFLFNEKKFWEKVPYFVNTEFLKAVRNVAFKNGITIDENMVKEFKKKYALRILSKIENIGQKEVRETMQKFIFPERFNYAMKNFTPYNVTLSGGRINRDFVKNLEEFFYLNIETLNMPSYDSLVSLSREYGKDAINKELKRNIEGLKNKLKERNFQEEYFEVMKNGDGFFYKNPTGESAVLRRMIFYNFDRVKEFVEKALKEIKIDMSEYHIKDLESFIQKVRASVKENVTFAPEEITLLKKAEEIIKTETDDNLNSFIKKAGWGRDETLNFAITLKRRLESLLSFYPEEETRDLRELSFMLEKYLRGSLDEKDLTTFLSETFFVEGDDLRDSFVSLSKVLKESVNTAEVRTAFLIEDAINDVYGIEKNIGDIDRIIDRIKDEKVKEAILNFDTSNLEGRTKELVEDFLYEGKIDSLSEIIDIEKEKIDRARFDVSGITSRNPLVKSFKTIIRAAKNLFTSDSLIDKEYYNKIKNMVNEEETKFYNGNVTITLDKDYVFEEIEKRFLNSRKDEFRGFLGKIKKEHKNDTIEITTADVEKTLVKLLIENKPLSSKESMDLFIFSKIAYPKIAVLQGTHDVVRSDGAFMFFTMNNPVLRELIHGYTADSLKKVFKESYKLFFSDAKNYGVKENFSNHMRRMFFNAVMNEGLTNSLKPLYVKEYKVSSFSEEKMNFSYIVNSDYNIMKSVIMKDGKISPSFNQYAIAFNPNDGLKINADGILKERAATVFSETPSDKDTYKMLFNEKTFDEMSREEIRNFLLDALGGNLRLMDRNSTYSTLKSKMYDFYEELLYSRESVEKVINRLNLLLKGEETGYKDKITDSVEVAAGLNGIKTQIKNFLKIIDENPKYQKIVDNLRDILENNFLESEKEINKILKSDIKTEIESFQMLKDNLESIKIAIKDAIKQINRFEIAAINAYVNKLTKEGWDYKDIMFLKENLSILNGLLARETFTDYTFHHRDKNLDNFRKTELEKRKVLVEKVFEKSDIDENLKDALLLYQTDQFYKAYAFGYARASKDKYLITANEASVKKDKEHLYLNTSELTSFSMRPGEITLMPESHFINRSVFGKEFAYERDSKSKYYAMLYTFGDEYTKGKKYVNVDKLRNKVFDVYGLHLFLNDLKKAEISLKTNTADYLTVEKVSDTKVKITLKKESDFLNGKREISIIVPFKEDFYGNSSYMESKSGGDYFVNLLRETKIIPIDDKYDKKHPYETLLSLAEKAVKENRKIEMQKIGLYVKDYDKKTFIGPFLNFYAKMNSYVGRLSERIKKDPSVYPNIIEKIKNAYEESVAKETVKIVEIKESIKRKIKEIGEFKESIPDYLLEIIKKDIKSLKDDFIYATNSKAAKMFIDYAENKKNFDFNNPESAKSIRTYVTSNRFGNPSGKEEGYKIMTQIIRNEREFVKNISQKNPSVTESDIFSGKIGGYADIGKKSVVTRGEIINGEGDGISVGSESKKTLSVSDFDKEIKRIVVMKQKDFNLSPHFEKVKKEFEKTYDIDNSRNKNKKMEGLNNGQQ